MSKILSLALTLVLPAVALAVAVEGKNYPASVSIEGQSLELVGAGLREKWMFDVYTLGAYSASGTCDPKVLVSKDEPKYLRLDMLRDVSAEKMASTLGDSFRAHLPEDAPAELKAQITTFQGYFKEECSEGTVLEFLYLPGQGTVLKQNGLKLGPPLTGAAFHRVLWDIYFGPRTCCEDLKEQIFKGCQK